MKIFDRIRAGWNGFRYGGTFDKEGFVAIDGDPGLQQLKEEQYLAVSAYFACIRNIAEDVGKLPFILYERMERGKKRAAGHELYQLIRHRAPGPITTSSIRETLVRFALACGDGHARIYRTKAGTPRYLQPVNTNHVKPQMSQAKDGSIEYVIKKDGKDPVVIPASDMIHIHGVGSNGISGMSVLSYGMNSLTFASAIRQFGQNLYTKNGRPGGYLKTAAKLNPEARNANGEAWTAANAGTNMGKTAVLDNGMEYHQVTINPTDAQYLETVQFTVEDVARWFRMPLHKIQYLLRAQGWSTLDAQNTDYLTDTLMPWLTRIEEEFTYKLLGGHDKYFCEHLVDGMLRGDSTTRADYYTKQFSIGALSINEIREMENRNPIEEEGGDKHFVPLNMTPAEFADSVSGRGSSSRETKAPAAEPASGYKTMNIKGE